MWLVDPYGYITTANAPAATMFGCENWLQLRQVNTLELFALEDRLRVVQAKQRAAREAQPRTEEYLLHTLTSAAQDSETATFFSAEITVSPILDAEGALKAILYRANDRSRQAGAAN